jgi:hypothetical protein
MTTADGHGGVRWNDVDGYLLATGDIRGVRRVR